MSPSRRKNAADAPYRIKDLTEKTGVSKETIRYYINEGLLPPPVKSAHNMGWYSERHVELLGLISKLQTERFLPLKAIRMLLRGKNDLEFTDAQARAFEEMRRRIASEHRDLTVTGDPGRLAEEMGLSRWEQKELLELGLAANGKVTMSDVEIARQWIIMRDGGLSLERGFSPRDLVYMKDVVDIALRTEIKTFRSRIDAMPDVDAAKVIEVVIPALNRLFALLHERSVREFVEALAGRLPSAGEQPAAEVRVGKSRRQKVRKPLADPESASKAFRAS